MSFKRLDTEDFVVSAESITSPAWSTNNPVLTSISYDQTEAQSPRGVYYISVYNGLDVTDEDAEIQFDIAFGARDGRGSTYFTQGISSSATSTIYGQYQNLIYGDENSDFIFGGISQSYFYAITLDRSRYKEKLLPGTFNLRLSDNLTLTDNSKDQSALSFTEAGRVYQIVKGLNGRAVGIDNTPDNAVAPGMTVSGSYGLFLPDIGTIILNATALDTPLLDGGISLGTEYTDNEAPSVGNNNAIFLFNALSNELASSFQLNAEETISSDFVFVRARNSEFNYSENPSFISGSQGTVIYDKFINNPQTYITSVGLYNDTNDLLAVAKLSKPLKKDFTKEALVRVKLDF
jgi:hypothetical protein